MTDKDQKLNERNNLRRAVADYMSSEGCACCRSDTHAEHRARLARMFKVRKYPDGSGYSWKSYETILRDDL